MSMRISHLSRSSLPLKSPFSCRTVTTDFRNGFSRSSSNNFNSTTRLRTKAVLSEVSDYPRISTTTTRTILPAELLQVVEAAAKTGVEVLMEAVNKPRYITYKGLTDFVIDTG
ncbi:unnamed protein product [Microthlaspi erraticum]|uniref:Uncharacterized protein n=1 Tax=Microthlaspi erraticum TaxID=1685480 RepID=A0A6D2J5Z3_9BRAS|nr:unnamed protein product [Microthlaspi erraticum]